MSTGKSVNKIVSFLLALIFISTNTAYSLDRTLRVPLQTKRVEEFLSRVTERDQALKRATEAVRISVIGGNWKMEVTSKEEAEALLRNIIESMKGKDISDVEVVVGVPIAFMDHLSKILRSAEADEENLKGKIKIAAQNIAGVEKGAQTGRTSILQVKSLGADRVIIGHSEQRRDDAGNLNPIENNAINNKVRLTLKEGLVPIVCIGESLAEREGGKTNSIVEDMIKKGFDGLSAEQVSKLIIAYEPVWAIGTGKTAATPQQAEEVLRFIRRLVLDMFGEDTASKVRIIYGGSVKPDNIAGLMDKSVIPDNDGALVGGASLKADSFIGIVKGVPVRLASDRIQTVFTGFQDIEVTGNTQFRIGYQPTTVVPDDLTTKTATIVAAALTDAGLRGKARGLDKKVPEQKAQIAEIKNASDGMAKRVYQEIIEEEDVAVNVHVSEGIGRDGLNPAEAFQTNEVVNPTGAKGTHHAIMDVIEGTNPFVTNVDGKRLGQLKDSESGATSIIATGAGIASLGNCPDSYVHYIGTIVPPEKMQEFTGENALDPETIAKDPSKTEEMLARIAKANNINIGDLEVVVMNRDREKQILSALAGLQKKYPGLKVITIEDGTVAHSLEAAFGRKEGKHKVVMTIGGAPEGFFNLAVAGLFKDQGALASMRVYSKHVNETASGEKATDMAARYNFDEEERADIQKMRSDDEAVLKGDRLFTQEDVKGDVEGSMAFITHNGVFGISGAEKLEDGSYKVKVLRFGNINVKPCAWFEEKTVIASSKAVGFDLAGSKLSDGFEMREGARDVKGLLKNLKGVLELDADGNVIVVNADKLRSETIDYLAKEAALNSNDDVKTAAQFLIRSAAISLGIIPASIHDFYMARKTNAWKDMTVPAVNIRTDGYETTRQVFRVVREQNIGAIILELAKSETRYSGQSVAEFTTVGFAAAIKEGYTGQIFFQGDHYQVDQKKYAKEPNKEIDTLKRFIRESILAGEYNIDLDPSTLVNEEALDEIVVFENSLVDEYLKDHSELTQGLDESGLKALRHKLIDELTLTEEQKAQLDALYERMHSDTAAVTMELIRYIRGLEKELFEGKVTISIGIEERHIDNPKHKNNPSTVRGSIALAQKVLKMCAAEGLVGPSKIALQTGTMHGLGGTVDFGIYERHLLAAQSLGIAVFVQHGASTIKDRADFRKMPIGGVGEVHLATEYQKITLGIVARMMPDLAEKIAQYLEDLMAANPDAYGKKFGGKWAQAFNDPAQQGKSRHDIIVEILADELPGKLAGSLKDLTKELSGPFKNEIWNAPVPVREAMRQALYKEFSEIFQMLGARETRELVESIIPVAKQPVVLAQRPEILTQAIAVASRKTDKGSPLHGAIAINDAGYKVGDIITNKDFAGLRNWSARTRGYELQSLVAIGILSRQDAEGKALPRGEYRIAVLPNEEQLNAINEKAKAIVNKTGRSGEALGIDYWILDEKHLGVPKLDDIAKVVREVTGSKVTLEEVPNDLVKEDIDAGMDLPASAAINGDVPFTVAGISLADAAGAAKTEQQALLAGLVDAKIASPEGSKLKGAAYDFSVVPAKVVMYKEEFVVDTPGQFEAAFKTLQPDQTAVIIVINKTDEEITQALIKANLSEEWGNRIVVMGVRPESAAAMAFGRLFGDKNMYDLRGQKVEDILKNKDLVEGLKGAV